MRGHGPLLGEDNVIYITKVLGTDFFFLKSLPFFLPFPASPLLPLLPFILPSAAFLPCLPFPSDLKEEKAKTQSPRGCLVLSVYFCLFKF